MSVIMITFSRLAASSLHHASQSSVSLGGCSSTLRSDVVLYLHLKHYGHVASLSLLSVPVFLVCTSWSRRMHAGLPLYL